MKIKERMLSKSRIISAYQCEKNLYLQINHPDLLPKEVDPGTQAIFDQGHEVGIEAQKRFPNGVLVTAEAYDAIKASEATRVAIQNGANTIYEATFIHENVQARVDILHRKNSKSDWEIIEVKSSTSIKEVYLQDVAIQAWVLQGAGIKVKRTHLMYINNECVYPNLKNLFNIDDITKDISPWIKDVPKKIASIRKTLASKTAPKTDIGPHCSTPYECPFRNHCFKHIPKNSIFDLPSIGKKGWSLYEEGIIKISDKKLDSIKLNNIQKRVVDVVRSGKRFIDNDSLKKILPDWLGPLSYLDFETVAFAIPRYKDTRPYQQIPFQFSVQVETKKGLQTHEYLHGEDTDPRPKLIEVLIKAIPKTGGVVSYNKGFEAGKIRDMAEAFPKYKKHLESIIDRLIDPWPIIRANVYDKGFGGSFSIKTVAPSLIGNKYSYDDLVIGDGGTASESYKVLISGNLKAKEKSELRKNMLIYCNQDTMAMVELVNWMRKQDKELVS